MYPRAPVRVQACVSAYALAREFVCARARACKPACAACGRRDRGRRRFASRASGRSPLLRHRHIQPARHDTLAPKGAALPPEADALSPRAEGMPSQRLRLCRPGRTNFCTKKAGVGCWSGRRKCVTLPPERCIMPFRSNPLDINNIIYNNLKIKQCQLSSNWYARAEA